MNEITRMLRTPAGRIAASACFAASLLTSSAPGLAQAYPSKAVRVIVPFPPGSALDSIPRLLSPRLGEALGQPIVVENRAGANGQIGLEYVARSAPDGYTILMGTSSTHFSAPYITKNLPYDVLKDFTPIVALAEPLTCLVVNPSVPVNSVKELIDHAKRNPGKLTYASWGIGGFAHLITEMFKQHAGVDLLHVPFKGAAQAMAELAAGRVDVAFTSVPDSRAFVDSGRARRIAMLVRAPQYAKEPLIDDVLPGFEKPPSMFGVFGPAGLPQPILRRLNGEFVKAINAPDARAKLEAVGLAIIANTPEEFATLMKKGLESYGKAAKLAGVKPE